MNFRSVKTGFALATMSIAVAAALVSPSFAEVVKIAHIDPFSGPAAGINQNNVRMLEFAIAKANKEAWAGPGVTFEAVAFDGKGSVQESLLQLKNASDQGIRYVAQGLSSSVGLGLIDGVNRYNERNPGKEMIYLTPTNQASEMTNEKCSYWFFRFDSNVDMRTEGLVSYLAKDKSLKKAYLINQNYAMGQQVSSSVKAALKSKRPDVEIVGDDLHPMLGVKDFTPYVAKIKASGADAIITANWSADLTLFVKAMKEAGMKTPLYTYNGATTGIPAALASAGAENVKVITYWVSNDDPAVAKQLVEPFKAKYDDDFVNLPWYSMIKMLAQAIKDGKSSEPKVVAAKLENLTVKTVNGEMQMRKSDHQLQQPLVIASWMKTNGKDVKYDLEKTGYGFKSIEKVDSYVSSLPTSCQMKRPQ